MGRIARFAVALAACFVVTGATGAVANQSASATVVAPHVATVSGPSWSPTGSWNEVFSDGFGGTTLNTSNWTPGWFGSGKTGPVASEEDAGYNSTNVTVSGGDLHLALTHQSITTSKGTFPYTGALVAANGKFDYAYGAIEFDAYLPPGGGGIANWPALW